VRRDDRVHRGERACRRQCVEEQVPAEAACHRQDDRHEHHQARVEEDREPEQQSRDAQCHGCPLLTEAPDQMIGQHLRPAGHLQQPPQHDAERDKQGDRPDGVGETEQQYIGDLGEVETDRDRRHHADQHQRHEGVQLELHDQEQQQRHRPRRDQQHDRRSINRLDGLHHNLRQFD
jgi:hypothetical protein